MSQPNQIVCITISDTDVEKSVDSFVTTEYLDKTIPIQSSSLEDRVEFDLLKYIYKDDRIITLIFIPDIDQWVVWEGIEGIEVIFNKTLLISIDQTHTNIIDSIISESIINLPERSPEETWFPMIEIQGQDINVINNQLLMSDDRKFTPKILEKLPLKSAVKRNNNSFILHYSIPVNWVDLKYDTTSNTWIPNLDNHILSS